MLDEIYLEDVNAAFSKQSTHFDDDDFINPILQRCRQQIYAHVDQVIKPNSSILELNAGTGIDAVRFARMGHRVHATDLSDGMIKSLRKKVSHFQLEGHISVQQLSFDQLDRLNGQKFDFIFSNFGGLNCIDDLLKVTKNIPEILNPLGFATWVIMPPVCPWEILGILKGNPKAFRRFTRNGTVAQLENESFPVWYHSLGSIKKAFGQRFRLVKHEGLAALSPPPYAKTFADHHPVLNNVVQAIDSTVRNYFPFNRWADHIIVTFQLDSH
jgi:ubiquinone/menaquinone biosynthesis C-methylase UbiE